MSRTMLVPLAFFVLMGSIAQAQYMGFIGAGSTPQGDYLRGVGIASYGMGVYNHQTAIANSINADTAMRINEYIYACLMNENRMNAEHRDAMVAKNKENYSKIRQRIDQNPEARDVRKGDALNVVLGAFE